MNNHLTLWVPGLRPVKQLAAELDQLLGQLPKQERPQLDNLNLLLSRADRISVTDVVKHDYILEQLGVNDDQKKRWPIAQWRLAIEELNFDSTGSYWLCADPVYIHPDRSEALLYAHEELVIQPEEAQALADLINQHYKDDPWQLHVGSSHRWYIKFDRHYDLTTKTLASVKGLNIFEHLPDGKDSHYWHQCMNEVQMLLHSCEINQQREEQGIMPINSLWFWGYGLLEEYDNLPWNHIYSNDAVLNGLGVSGGSVIDHLPVSADNVVNDAGEVLVYYDKLPALLQQQDIYGWLSELQLMENDWFNPLIKRLKNNPGMQLTLLMDNGEAYKLTAKNLKRWWLRNNKNNLF